jgi:DNA repair protein RecN (Recombination protein N)
MLLTLTIRDFVIVDRAELEFRRGFTVLTGETGAGKSILIDALAMVLGERGDPGVVRQGAERAEISAEFEIGAARDLRRWLADNDLTGDADTCLVRRVIDTGGRSRAFINGRGVTLAQLREAGEHLVDIHGQHEHQSLLRAATQRALLDAYGGLGEAAVAVGDAWRRWQELRQQLTAFETNAAAFAAEREQLEWQVRELDQLKFTAPEWQELQEEHARLAHAQSLLEGAQYAMDALSEDDNSAVSRLTAVQAKLERLIEYDSRLKEVVEMLASAHAQAQEAVYLLCDYQQRLDLDPRRFAQVEQRLSAIHDSARKYRTKPDALPDTLARAQERLQQLSGSGDVETLRRHATEAHEAYLAEARKLTAGRRKAAKKLSEKVSDAMQTLALAGGSFEVALQPLAEGHASGLEQIEFLVSAHKGIAPRPLAKVASGGELSRISLAIQTVASEIAQVPTLIFDEVDAGIGGRVAEIVGRMLNRLGRSHQVMCITHLPQVAASADQQWQVSKSADGKKVLTHVAVLDDQQRVEEVARMLGGVRITETTRKHAAEMLRAVNGRAGA